MIPFLVLWGYWPIDAHSIFLGSLKGPLDWRLRDQGMPKVQAVEKVRSTDWVRWVRWVRWVQKSLGQKLLETQRNPGTLEPEVINTSADLQVTV